MAKKPSIDFKQLLVQKGEKFGFFACAGLLLMFIALGGLKASSSASTADITKEFQKGVAGIDAKIQSGPADPPPLDPVTTVSAKTDRLAFTDNATANDWFGKISTVQARRASPKLYPPSEAVAEFVRGSISVYEIIKDPQTDNIQVGILMDKKPSRNLTRQIKVLQRKKPGQPVAGKAPTPPAPPPAAPPGGAPTGGGPGGGRMAPGGPGGGRMGPGGEGGFGTGQSTEQGVEYVDLDSKQLEQAKWAETILPTRMAVVTGTVPFRKQAEEYARALRLRNVYELQANDLPLYKSYDVERAVVAVNGKPVEDFQWDKLDLTAMLTELYAIRLVDTEPEAYDKDRELARAYLERIVPEDQHRLVIPRPKLVRGKYEPAELKTVDAALKKIKDEGELPKKPNNSIKQKMEDFDPFNRSQSPSRQGGQGPTGGGAGVDGPGGGVPGEGRGRPAPGGPLRGGDGPGGFGVPQQNASPEEAWLMRFVDITVEPGRAYRYKVRLKAANPNYKRPVAELAYPGLAEKEDLDPSPWFVVPNDVEVPRDENIYVAAGAGNDKAKASSERMSLNDDVYLQVQHWYDYIRLPNERKQEPLGEWLSLDLKATRGQYLGETVLEKIPLWSITAGEFLLREQRSKTGAMRKGDVRWPIDVQPVPQMLLVDFEGGRGTYMSGRKQVQDVSSTDVLLYSEDGKLQVYRSMVDMKDETRQKREATWKKWVEEVDLATRMKRMGNAPGGVPGGGGPGGDRSPG